MSMSEMSEREEGARLALIRASAYAKRAGKTRTGPWLRECANLVAQQGFGSDLPWPPAPAYKGPVVHINLPEQDLREMAEDQLAALLKAVEDEQLRREGD